MSNEDTTKTNRDRHGMAPADWQRLNDMTDEEINARALTDPDNPPLTEEQLARVRRPSLARKVRQRLRMGRESSSQAYGIPIETLNTWERHEAEPTAVEAAYLRLIEREPERAKIEPAPPA